MDKNDEIIEIWLQQEISMDEVMPDEDVEPDLVEHAVQPEPTRTVSSIPRSSSRASNQTDSSDEDIPLSYSLS
ncbi:hypothetical protein HHI36_014445 [Cryptolaemus montrouzieri]|uniref:Uncharacterized protein n=1 Tax=Cryptolaemus montrouzieri TaxID=559131 RepID=A0ABD2N2S5_9CUCU